MISFFSLVTRFLIIIFGTLLPARNTHEALGNKEELLTWSKYWIVYGCLMTVEIVGDTFFTWLPFYGETKLLIVLWLVISAPSASVWIFDVILNPLMGRYMHRLDAYLRYEKRHLLADALNYSSKLYSYCLDKGLPMVKGIWKKPIETAENVATEVVESQKDDTLETLSIPQPNIFYDASVDEEAHHATLASSDSCTQLLEPSSQTLIPDLAMKTIDISNRHPSGRSKRKSYIYEQFDDVENTSVQKEDKGVEDLLQRERLAIELQQHPILQRRDTRRRYH